MKKVNPKITGMFLIAAVLTAACAKKQYTVKSIEVARVEMDSAWEPAANTAMQALVDSLRTEMTGKPKRSSEQPADTDQRKAP